MTTNSNQLPATAREAVLAILGGGPSSAGEAIVDFVDDTVYGIDESIDAKIADHRKAVSEEIAKIAKRVRGSEGLATKQKQLSEALVALASRADSKEIENTEEIASLRKDVSQLRAIVATAGRMMAGAMEATNVAAQANANADPKSANAKIDEANNLLDQAEAKQSDCCDEIAKLENRVAELERWRKDVVDPALKAHMESIDSLNSWRKDIVDPFIKRQNGAALKVTAETQKAPVAPVAPAPKVEVSSFQRRIDPRNWGVLSYVLAVGFGIIALAIAVTWIAPAILGMTGFAALKWFAVVAVCVGLVGASFCCGGILGSFLSDRLESTSIEPNTTKVTVTS